MSKLDKATVAVMDALETARLAGHGVTDTDLRNALRPFFEAPLVVGVDHAAPGRDGSSIFLTDHGTFFVGSSSDLLRIASADWANLSNSRPIGVSQNVANVGSKRWDHAK